MARALRREARRKGARKDGRTWRRVWRKVHLVAEEATPEVPAAEIVRRRVGDALVRPDGLGPLPEGEPIASVTADGA